MKYPRWSTALRSSLVLVLVAGAAACGSSSKAATTTLASTTAPASSTTKPLGGELKGTFAVVAADCAAGAPTKGSYFRMIQGGGTIAAGPFVPNGDSTCKDQTFNALVPGTDGGLVSGTYQAQPDAPFDAAKNGVAAKIVAPVKFFAVGFAVSTNAKDPASGTALDAPKIVVDAKGKLSGSTSAVSVSWNGQQFNQGSPKPDGSKPGITADLSGTYDPATGAYVLEWASQIVGGPFNGFTGLWHLEGTFKSA